MDLLKYFDKDLDLSFTELERMLCKFWVDEIAEAFDIKKPEDYTNFIDGMILMREIITTISSNKIKSAYIALKNYGIFKKMNRYWDVVNKEEKLIMTAPFLTTIDTCMINFLTKNKPERLSELFKNTPITYVPMITNEKYVICMITPNESDHPGNSVFGPKGVICPGNIVTSMLVKAMLDLMNELDYDIIGKPTFNTGGTINRISNSNEIRFISKAYKPKPQENKEQIQSVI